MKLKYWLRTIVCGGLLFSSATNPIFAANQRLPVAAFSLNNMQGEQVSLEQYKGKVVLVNFWATWCPPCIMELPSMQRLKLALSDQPFEIVAINVGERFQHIENFMVYFGKPLDFPILVNDSMSVANAWNIRAMPTTVLIDKQGQRVATIQGVRDWSRNNVLAMLKPLLEE